MDNHNEFGTQLDPTDIVDRSPPPGPVLPDVSDAVVDDLAAEMERNGFAVLRDYIQPSDLLALQAFVEKKVDAAGGEYVSLTGKPDFKGTLLDAIADAPPFLRLIHRLYGKARTKPATGQSLYQVLRCLKGQSGMPHSYFFHFDSYVVTVLLPIIIPTVAQAGDLIMIPNTRKIRSTYVRNILDKLVIDNKLTQRFLKRAYGKKQLGFVQVKLVPGNLYMFWGYRTLHANEPSDPAHIRATALYHFGDPHVGSSLRKFTGQAKVRATVEPASTPA